MKQRIVCWVGDAPNHRALVNKIAANFTLAGVIIDSKKVLRKKQGLRGVWNKILDRLRYGKIDKAWSSLQQFYREKYPEWPPVPILQVDSINEKAAHDFTFGLHPDLIVVSGTSLVKEPLISMDVPMGIMNLHTGLSPYVKGGPNCTNWCIANGEWDLIGNTIMWLSAGIDSGNIITSERTQLSNADDLPTVHRKVMEHAHDLYVRAIKYVLTASLPYQSISQSSLGKGNLYLTKMWTAERKNNLIRNMRMRTGTSNNSSATTIPLP